MLQAICRLIMYGLSKILEQMQLLKLCFNTNEIFHLILTERLTMIPFYQYVKIKEKNKCPLLKSTDLPKHIYIQNV